MSNPNISQYGSKTRFKPGISGNKKGRPVGSLNMSTLVKALLSDEDLASKVIANKPDYWDHLPTKTFATAIITAMMLKAFNGDVRAASWIRVTGFGNKIDSADEQEIMPVCIIDMSPDVNSHNPNNPKGLQS